MLTEITRNAKPMKKQPGVLAGVLGFALTEDLLNNFKAELAGTGWRSDDGVLITQPAPALMGVDMATEPSQSSKILLNGGHHHA